MSRPFNGFLLRPFIVVVTCPNGDYDDPMDVVWHHHKFAWFDIWKMVGYSNPKVCYDPPKLVQEHLPIGYSSEKWFAVLGHDGHKISAWLRIIEFRQA